MEYMSIEDVDLLAGMQLKSLEVAKIDITPFDVANKVYVDTRFVKQLVLRPKASRIWWQVLLANSILLKKSPVLYWTIRTLVMF